MFCVHSLRSSSILAGSPFMRITRPCMLGTSSKGEYDVPESPGRPDDFTPSKRPWLSLSRAVFLLVQPEVFEAFRDRKPLASGHLGRTLPDGFLQLSPVTDLAFMLAQSLDLEIDRVADVHPGIGLVRTCQVN